jgi:aminopeptidase N
VPSLLRGFSAPVRLAFDCADDELLFLMAHESDGFNRWDAAQTLMQRLLLRLVDDPDAEIPTSFYDAFRRALTDADAEKALLAEVLSLPSESYLADQMPVADVDGIHRARQHLRANVAETLRKDLLGVFRGNAEQGPYVPSPEAIGRRALKNLTLSYLASRPDDQALELARSQFAAGHNMTDVMTALRSIVDHGGPGREEALAGFHDRWSGEPLVIDKWFAVQAMSSGEDTLERVIALTGHADFSLRNPNRVRSLIGAFSAGNPVRFHGADGGGYRFLADQVMALDPLNPQLAARLLRGLIRWRRFDPGRQALMRAEIERILDSEALSKDAYEVASKALSQD